MHTTAAARPVVVGIDGSTSAERILEWALGEALVCQAPVRVVTVWAWDGQAGPGPSRQRPERSTSLPAGWARQVQETLVARVLAQFGTPAPAVTAELAEGDPASQLIQRCSDAQLLVLGAKSASHDQASRSVTDVCTRYAGCPVVVVPTGELTPRPADAAVPPVSRIRFGPPLQRGHLAG